MRCEKGVESKRQDRETPNISAFLCCETARPFKMPSKSTPALSRPASTPTHPFFAGKLLLHCAVSISDVLPYARRLFLLTPNPDVFMYNTLIRGLSESDSPQESLLAYAEMRRKLNSPPDSFSFTFVLKAAANLRCLGAGCQLHCQALTHGLDSHLFVGTTLISLYAECGCVGLARKVFDEMSEPNVVAWNAVVTACFRCGDVKVGELDLAKKLFVDMPMKDDVSWSTMIVGFAHSGCFDDAFGFFRELRRVGIRPNEVSLSGVLSACAQAGAYEFGKILHGYVEKAGLVWISSVNNALLDTYSKCGNVGMTRLVFERMPGKKSLVSWTSMMAGLAMQGYGEEAIQLFHEMENCGVRPDGITFISILYACSHAGLIEEGCGYFNKMMGNLQKAYEFVTQMPISPNAIIWRTLLGACSIHNNVELAEQVKKRLVELDPNNSSDHVLLSNIYAVAGKWKDVATVRRSMTDQRLKKTPGWSMIEVDKVMYSFVAGQKKNKITEEAYEKLSEIMLKLRAEGGYVPEVGNVLHDIEAEEKEDALSKHSEKLAVAFGIARLCKGSVVRIVKNLRVCKDCHTVMKLISKVYGLEIVVRDRSRFHAFKQGLCSCRDYW
ncbi:tetratricopeptide repeat (TPR)-like superfamily protein [Actinidia rufa]|uniref:Tetratricopeptide repeat (TPR)-like superfamily protein n=1 Tax=Actinidia rufa TaxID=165716 RepID=A0A7J0EEY2_9ERIC|nr:tetratricopeptide repeat (TPR)-like superfamily protein [Actinidia rufa]